MNKLCKKYLRMIKSLFPIHGKDERNYIKKFKDNLESGYDESMTTLEDLYNEFGTPEEVINSYYMNVDTEQIVKRIRISKCIKFLSIFLVLVICAYITMQAYITYKTYKVF